ncbi:MAG TPA: dipeptidase, partial [Longimicrobiaceae bacterium]|nr:dipeptidase [Longimicrobiaceae bacterium]
MYRPIRLLLVLLSLGVLHLPVEAQPADPHLQRALRVLRSTPLIDGHNDLPWAIRESRTAPLDIEAYDLRQRTPGHTDLARLSQGRVGAQFWSVYIPGEYADSGYARVQLEQIDVARRIIDRYREFEWALTADGIVRSFRRGKIGSLLGLEGGHAIENSLGALRVYYDLGARYMTLTHNVTLDWADAAVDTQRHGGLTRFGEEVVREMNRLGMLVDLSHVSPGTMSDALNVTEAPVIFSHSNARALTDVPRNVPDSILQRLPQNGGLVMVTFVPMFISQEVANHQAVRDRAIADLRRQFPGDTAGFRRGTEAWRAANPAPRATLSQV